MVRLAAAAAFALVLGTAGCTSAGGVDEAQLYAVGCPAVDAVVSGSGAGKDAAISLLKSARDSGQLDAQPTRYVDATIEVLQGTKVSDLPKDARTALVDGCRQHGHPLSNV